MKHTDTAELAVRLLNSTLGLDDLSPEMHGRIATALVLLDRQDEENIFVALQDARKYIEADNAAIENFVKKWDERND